jgi:hypothetical protein
MQSARFLCNALAIIIPASLGTGCMTTYDAYGRPVQSVDPALAIAGAAAAGLAGYAIGQNNAPYRNDGCYGGGYRGGYGYRPPGHGYYARPGYCY